MANCQKCGIQAFDAANYCSACGAPQDQRRSQRQPYPSPSFRQAASSPASINDFHPAAARGFSQIFGIHPAIAFLTFIVDTMLFGGSVVTWGLSLPFDIAVACVLGVIAYKAQMKWYGDDKDSALIKALILAFLTAIPTNIPAFVYGTSGLVGFFRKKE